MSTLSRLLRRWWQAHGSPAGEPLQPASGPVWARPLAMRPVGVVQNGIREARSRGWDGVISRIMFDPALREGLRGLDGFSHLIVLTWLHVAAAEPRHLLAIFPGGDVRLPLTGVFALRVGGRPNPIGCSVVRLLRVTDGEIEVAGLDAVDGTPVLDVKPYLPPYDSVPDALLPGWALPD